MSATLGVPSTWLLAAALPITLLLAWLFGAIARWLLRGRARLRVAASMVISILGIAIGLFFAGVINPDTPLWSPLSLLLGLGTSIGAIAVYGAVAAHFQRPQRASLAELITAGESDRVEFKSTARINLHTGAKDERMEQVIAKTACGFLNADGGTLVIGVDDHGVPLGLDADLATMKSPDVDRYELWLRDLLTTALGPNAAAEVAVEFTPVPVAEGGTAMVCRLTCGASPRPVYLRTGKSGTLELWVRVGNSTRQLGVDQATEYVMHRWPLNLGSSIAAQLRAAVRFSEVR